MLLTRARLAQVSRSVPTAGPAEPTIVKTTNIADEEGPDHHHHNTDGPVPRVPDEEKPLQARQETHQVAGNLYRKRYRLLR